MKRKDYEKLTPEEKEETRRKAREYHQTRKRRKKFNKEVQLQVVCICYMCLERFANYNALLEHITKHVVLPSIILTRIDKPKLSHTIEIEIENSQINSGLINETSQNVINIKTELIEYDEDIKHEVNNIHMDLKTETDIEVDDVTFYTRVKKEEPD